MVSSIGSSSSSSPYGTYDPSTCSYPQEGAEDLSKVIDLLANEYEKDVEQ